MAGMRFEHRMSDADALMWRIEKDPQLRSTIGVVTLLDRPPDWDRLSARVDYALSVIPRLTQKVAPVPLNAAPPRWVHDAEFDLSYHLRRMAAPAPGDLPALLGMVGPLLASGFDRARPLWEFTVVEGLEGGRAALIQKIHHALTDGVGGVEMSMMLLDFDREGAPNQVGARPGGESPTPWELLTEAIGHNLRRNVGMARRALPQAAALAREAPAVAAQVSRYASSTARLLAPARAGASPLFRGRSLARHLRALSVDLEATKAAGRAAGGTLNDAFVAAVAGGLGRYHLLKGAPVEELRMGMPISVRTEATRDVAGNQFAPARLMVPVGGDPAERLRAIGERVRAARAEPALEIVSTVSALINRLPTALAVSLFKPMLQTVDVTTSNVPGAPVPVYTAGSLIEANYPFGPTAGAAVNVTLLSYKGSLDIGINADAAAVDDPDLLRDSIEESFREVHKLA